MTENGARMEVRAGAGMSGVGTGVSVGDVRTGMSMSGVRTPAYIFDEAAFAARAAACRRIVGSGIGLCFSMKANPFLVRALPPVIDLVEACSPGELRICEKSGLDMSRVVYSGVSKGADDIRRAILDGVGAVTAESPLQYGLISREAERYCRRVPVLLRLTDGSQFGMDEKDLMRIVRQRVVHPGADICGIHYFTGTQKRSPKTVIKQLEMLEVFAESLRSECGFSVRWLEYGPGLDAEYFVRDDAQEVPGDGEKERLADERSGLGRLREVVPTLRRLSRITRVTVEMGRLLAAPCGTYLTSVCDTKVNMGTNYAILDGGVHQMKYDGQFQGMYVPEMSVLRGGRTIYSNRGGYAVKTCDVPACTEDEARSAAAGRREPADAHPWTLYGSLCSTADVFVRDIRLPHLRTGDVVAFHNTGAYSMCEGPALFLSRDMPAIWRQTPDGSLELLRDRTETYPLNM